MPFIPPPPKELQKGNENNPTPSQPKFRNPNADVVRPMEEPLPVQEEKPQEEKKLKSKPKQKRTGVGEKGRLVLCIVGVVASLALVGFLVYLLAF